MIKYPDNWAKLDTSLCHDWLTGMRGGERVLELLCDGFPDASIYTLIQNPDAVSDAINRHRVITSYLQNIPGIMKSYRYFLPVFPSAVRNLPEISSELLISTSHCVAKAIPRSGKTAHLCYCFTPMRYAWLFSNEYIGQNPVKRILTAPLLSHLRKWDKKTSGNVDHFTAISKHVQKRIKDFYGRDADVVYPPVDTKRCTISENSSSDYDLIVSALVPYKKIDLAVKAYNRTGYPLMIAGTGTEERHLRKSASSNIRFLGWQSDSKILELYQNCRMLIFPGEEDFGIVPVEAQACGKPVVAFAKGGALETVIDRQTGVYFHSQSDEALADAIAICASTKWDRQHIRKNAESFSTQFFIDGISESIRKCLSQRH